VLAAGLAFAGSALAAAQSADISGAWTFRAGKFENGCVMSGKITLKPAGKDAFTCALETHEVCPGIEGGAKQSCTATRKGAKLSVKSKVLSVDPVFSNYAADDFELDIVSGVYMKGQLHSAGTAPAEFFRGDAPIS
jgi:hypothetical protein